MKEKDFIKNTLNENYLDKEKIRNNVLNVNISVRRRNYMKKGWAIAIVICLLSIAALTSMTIYAPINNLKGGEPYGITAYSDVYDVINSFNKIQNSFDVTDMLGRFSSEKNMDSEAPLSVNEDYSSTNVQTEGMDEGDIVKNDGRYIYKINTQGVIIVEAEAGNLEIKSSIKINNYVPQELYVNDNLLIIIGGVYEQVSYKGATTSIMPMMDYISFMNYSRTDIRIYDITDISEPVLKRQVTVDGSYYTSRLLESENKLYYMVNYNFYYGNEDMYIPKIMDTAKTDGNRVNIPQESIFIYDDICNYTFLILGEISLDNPDEDSNLAAYLGLGGAIYVSSDNIYVSTYDNMSIYERNLLGWTKSNSNYIQRTRIVKIGLDTLRQKASGRVNGTIKDRYSMDEYQGNLRIATTVYGEESYNNLYVLNPSLAVIGKVENLAPDEVIYSVKFNKDKGIMVTFALIDPYFNIDLSDPYNPVVTGEHKEPGVSYYLHIIEDTDYTIGIGKMSEVVSTPYGDNVRWTGLKVSLYNNAGGQAVLVTDIIIDGSVHAELFYNPKALLVDESRNMIAFSYENWQYNNNYYYNAMTQGLAVFKYDLDAENDDDKLIYRKTLTNLNGDVNINYDWDAYFMHYLSFISRGIQIENYIYTVSDKYIVSYDIETLTKIDDVDLYQ